MRSRVRRVARSAAMRVGPIERLATTVRDQRRELDRLHAESAEHRGQVDGDHTFGGFFAALEFDGDVDRGLVMLTRDLVTRPGGPSQARIYAQALQQYDGIRPVAEICLALCAYAEPMPDAAWALFTRNDLALVVRWAAEEYFRLGFARDRATAAAALRDVLRGAIALEADPHVWLEIAGAAFAAGELDLAAQTLGRAETALPDVTDPERVERLHARTTNLHSWIDRATRPTDTATLPDGEFSFAVVGFAHPDWNAVSRDLGDYTDSLVALGHLLCHEGLDFVGAPDLVEFAEKFRENVPGQFLLSGSASTVHLHELDRDLSSYTAVPDGTWTFVSEWGVHPLGYDAVDLPLNVALRPIFVSFHITPDQLRAPGVVDYLRAHGPIGCRDRDTVLLLHAAGVDSFFSGALTATAQQVFQRMAQPPRPDAAPLFVDCRSDGAGPERGTELIGARVRSLGANLQVAHSELQQCRDSAAPIVTTDVRVGTALRALGCQVELRDDDPADYRAIDYTSLARDDFAAMQDSISDKLAVVLSAVLSGYPDEKVYALWREVCAEDVARARAELHRFPDYPELAFDLAQVRDAIGAASVVVERSEPGPSGDDVNVEFSVDENYKHQFDVVLDSVVERCSRPVRAFVLCRGYDAADFERMATLFPTVSFVWLPTDSVDHGNVRGKIPWATIVTMDRTILPELLPDVDRIIHFDLDALCLADFAELFDTDLEGTSIAAADEPQPSYGRGFNSLRDSARLLRAEGLPDLANEYLARTHAELVFDFEIFNAGVMVLDLARLRATDFCRRYLAYVSRFGINGQRVLNVGVGRERKKLSADWNRLVRLEVDGTAKIAHWAGPFKPWAGHAYVPGRDLWRAQEQHFAERAAAADGTQGRHAR